MNHTAMVLFSFFCLLCIFVSVTFTINARNVWTTRRSIEAIKLWKNKLDILMPHLQSFMFNCRISALVMMVSRENTAGFSHHRLNFQLQQKLEKSQPRIKKQCKCKVDVIKKKNGIHKVIFLRFLSHFNTCTSAGTTQDVAKMLH